MQTLRRRLQQRAAPPLCRRWRCPSCARCAALSALSPPPPGAAAPPPAAAAPAAAVAPPAPRKSPPPPPPVDFTTLVACVREVASVCCAPASKVTSVVQTDANTLCLSLRTPAHPGRAWLWLSWHPTAARLCLGPPPPVRPDADAFSLGAQLRARLAGAALTSASVPTPFERVASLDFAPRPGEATQSRLILEALGPHANAFLLDSSNRVTAAGAQHGKRHTRERRLASGSDYEAPPPPPGPRGAYGEPPEQPDATDCSAAEATHAPWRVAVETAAAASVGAGKPGGVGPALSRALSGCSPALSSALTAASDIDPSTRVADMGEREWGALEAAVRSWAARVAPGGGLLAPGEWGIPSPPPPQLRALPPLADSDEAPSGESGGGGDSGGVSHAPSPPPSSPPASPPTELPHAPVCSLVHSLHSVSASTSAVASRRSQLLGAVRGALRKATSRAAGFAAAAAAGSDAGPLRERADLLLSQLHAAAPGAASVALKDWASGDEVVVPLDPSKPALATAQAMHARARKLARGAASCGPRLEAAAAEAEYLSSIEQQLSACADDETALIADIEAELVAAKLVQPAAAAAARAAERARKSAGGRGAKQPSTSSSSSSSALASPGSGASGSSLPAGVRRYRSPSGLEVLVGRHNRGNEAVSHSLARDCDTWLHVRGCPGAHVILRGSPGKGAPQPPAACLQFAANLAAFHSRETHATKALVSYTSPRHVRRAPGGRLGAVVLACEEVMVARPQDVKDVQEAAA